MRVKREGPEELVPFGEKRLALGRSYAITEGEVTKLIRPVCLGRDVRDDDPSLEENRRPA